MDWMPIETAPKDGTAILAWPAAASHGEGPISYVVCWWSVSWDERLCGWREAAGDEDALFEPTHWMPLPAPPQALSEAA